MSPENEMRLRLELEAIYREGGPYKLVHTEDGVKAVQNCKWPTRGQFLGEHQPTPGVYGPGQGEEV